MAYTQSDIRNRGSGCAIWIGDLNDITQLSISDQDLYIRMSSSELGVEHALDIEKLSVILVVSIFVLLVMIVAIGFCLYRRRAISTAILAEKRENASEHRIKDKDLDLPLFDLATIVKVMNNFSPEYKLGQGGFGSVFKVPETLPEEVLAKMSAPPKSETSVITPDALPEADGFVFGFPTRFGMMAAQLKAFLDATGGLWRTQVLAGKPAGIFYSTGSQGGGQETTALTAVTQLVHHGMIFVPIGYTFGAGMFEMENVKGGSPYGAGTFAGDGLRQPSELELEQAFHQGKYMATITKKLKIAA